MTYHCGKFDDDRIPSTCDFETDNSSDMLDHINYAHSVYYCHRCSFKSRIKENIEDHSHYEDLFDDIFICNVCGIPFDDGSKNCKNCSFKSEPFSMSEDDLLECDMCDFNTKDEIKFINH